MLSSQEDGRQLTLVPTNSSSSTLARERSDTEAPPSAEALLVEQVRRGDVDAVRRFFHDHYPSIYQDLLWLTERPKMAEDFTNHGAPSLHLSI